MPTDPLEELAKLRLQCGFSKSMGNCGDDATIVSAWIKNALTKNTELVQECMEHKAENASLRNEAATNYLRGRKDMAGAVKDADYSWRGKAVKAIDLLRAVRATLVAAPELNPANYTEEEVFALNSAVCEVVCAMDSSDLNLCVKGNVP